MDQNHFFAETTIDQNILDLSPGRVFDNKYKILSFIDQGGMGAVYKVEDINTHKVYALKILLDNSSDLINKRFLREIKVSEKLDHSHIVKIHNANVFRGKTYMVMEYVEGLPLDEYAKKYNLSLEAKMQLIYQIALALHYAHRRQIIHRDIKPANIIVTNDGIPKIMDFGLAKITKAKEYELTKTGEIMGTPRYMSPEQITGKNSFVDKATDIYSLGAIMYELIVGVEMISGSSTIEILYNIERNRPSTIKNVPRMIEEIWLKSTDSKYNRYKNASVFAQELKMFIDKKEFSFTQRTARTLSRNKKRIYLLSSISLCLVGIFFAFIMLYEFQVKRLNKIHELIFLGLHTQAQQDLDFLTQSWNITEDKELNILQLKLYDAKLQYELVWNDKKTNAIPEIAVLKVKAAYYLSKNLLEDIEVKRWKEYIAEDARLKSQVLFYDFLYLHKQILESGAEEKKHEKTKQLTQYYEDKQTDITLLHDENKIEIGLILANAYLFLAETNKPASLEKVQKAEKLYEIVYTINKERFDAIKGLAKCKFILQKPDEKNETLQYLLQCHKMYPNDIDILLMLAKTYEEKQPSQSYLYYTKVIRAHNVESLQSLFELDLKDGRYANQSMWFLMDTLSLSQREKEIDLLREEVESIRNKTQRHYQEFLNSKNDKEVNIVALHDKVTDEEQEVKIRDIAKKALVLEGYKPTFSVLDIDIQKDIYEEIMDNKYNLLLHLLAENYLYESTTIQKELKRFEKDILLLFHDKKEKFLYRYLAAKSLLNICLWSPIIAGLSQKEDNELTLICNTTLYEVGFIYDYNHIKDVEPKSWEEIVLYARITSMGNARIKEHILEKGEFTARAETIKVWRSLLEHSEKKVQAMAKGILTCISTIPNDWASLDELVENDFSAPFQNYLYSLYWKSTKLINNLQIPDITLFTNQLSSGISSQSKMIMLDSYLLQNKYLKEILDNQPKLKHELVTTTKTIIFDDKSDFKLRLKATYYLGQLTPYESEYFEIVNNIDLPILIRTIMPIFTFIHQLKTIIQSPKIFLQDPNQLINLKNKLYALHNNVKKRHDTELFKNVMSKISFFLAVENITYLSFPESEYDNLKANTFMNFASDNAVKGDQFKFLWDLQLKTLEGYEKMSSRERDKLISLHLNAKNTHIRMAAWVAKTFFASPVEIEKIYNNACQMNDPYVSMGVSWGIHRKMSMEVYQKIEAYTSSSFKTYMENYMDELEKSLATSNKGLEYIENLNKCIFLEESIPLENRNTIYIANYLYQQAFIYWHLKKEAKALECLSKIEKLSLNEEYLSGKKMEHLILKARILFISKEENQVEIAKIVADCLKEKEHYSLYKILEIVEHYHQKDPDNIPWKNLYVQSNQKLIFSVCKIANLDVTNERFLYNYVADCHKRLALLENAEFNYRCEEIIRKKYPK